jgi:MarR family transcriptional regulator, organic hydroperoxide resistance regulator
MDRTINGRGVRRSVTNGCYFRLALTVSRASVLRAGKDQRFREMVADLITVSQRIQKVRDILAARIGITGPQYSILLAIARMGLVDGVNVRTVAGHLNVSAAFVTAEAGKLMRQGLIAKSPSSFDGRSVLLSLTRLAEKRLEHLTPEIRAVNDRFFASLDRQDFVNLARIARTLVEDSERALSYISTTLRDGGLGLTSRTPRGARIDGTA